MPDRAHAEKRSKRKASPPKHPPRELPQDYSSLPQKPIKLKSEVTLPPVLKRAKGEQAAPRTPEKSRPATAKRAKRPPTPAAARVLEGLSAQAKEAATAAAAKEGLELTVWLERLIMAHAQHQDQDHTRTLANIDKSLETIDERLGRLEDQRGFWSRFWDQFMEPYRRQQQ